MQRRYGTGRGKLATPPCFGRDVQDGIPVPHEDFFRREAEDADGIGRFRHRRVIDTYTSALRL